MSEIFPNNKIKQDIVTEYRSSEYNINELNYELLGFKITASDIEIHVNPKEIDYTMTRVDIPLILAKDVKVSNSHINFSYKEVNLGSVYGIYDKTTDKMTVHVDGTQFIEYPDEQNKVEIPYKDDDKKAWINVEAYNICVQEEKQWLTPMIYQNSKTTKQLQQKKKSY